MTQGRKQGQRWLVLALVGAAALMGCQHKSETKKGSVKCPESENLTCLSREQCSTDRERGCDVCRCAPADGDAPSSDRVPTAMQPQNRF